MKDRSVPFRRRMMALFVVSSTSAVLLATLVGILQKVNVASHNSSKKLTDADAALQQDALVRTARVAASLSGQPSNVAFAMDFQERATQERASYKLKKFLERVHKLNSYVKKFFLPQLNFMKPTARAAKKYGDAYEGVLKKRSSEPGNFWILFQDQNDYQAAYGRAYRKLESLRRTTSHFVITAVALMSAAVVVAFASFLFVGAALLKCIRHHLTRVKVQRGIVPAYIIDGRLFVDKNYTRFPTKPFDVGDDDVGEEIFDNDDDDLEDGPENKRLLNDLRETELTHQKRQPSSDRMRHRKSATTPDLPDLSSLG